MWQSILYGIMLVFFLLLTGCGNTANETGQGENTSLQVPTQVEITLPEIKQAEPSGILVEKNEVAEIDYSHTADGYVMVRYLENTEQKLKAQVKGPKTTYTYNLEVGRWEIFPLSDGNGQYKIAIYQNVQDSKYALVQAVETEVILEDEFAPFLRPNQYVNYAEAENTIYLAAELTAGKDDVLAKVEAVYTYVVTHLTYDKELAEQVQSGYLPVLDDVLARGKGICFDYAALMTAMLRSQSIPCKLVVGYVGDVYHAWISVYSEQDGWIENVIYFDGREWKRMDPTFASSSGQSEEMLEYIGDGSNYTEKYLY